MNYRKPKLARQEAPLESMYVLLHACRVCKAFVSLTLISSLAPRRFDQRLFPLI